METLIDCKPALLSFESEPSSSPQKMTKPGRETFSSAYAAIFATVLIWSTPSLFQFYLNRFYDPWAQNFYRYAVACIAVMPFVLYRFRRSGPRLDRGTFLACLIPALPNVVHQIAQTVALFHMGPGVFAIFIRSSVIITTLLALIFFPRNDGSFANGSFNSERCSVWSARWACSGFNRAAKAEPSRFGVSRLLSPPAFAGRSIACW